MACKESRLFFILQNCGECVQMGLFFKNKGMCYVYCVNKRIMMNANSPKVRSFGGKNDEFQKYKNY